jgi:hypothetical protein
VPLSREAVRRCQQELQALAASIVALEKPRVQGIAIASDLAFDGGSALYFQPITGDPTDRLANTIQAACTALQVSPRFDEPELTPGVEVVDA